jgi:hypothetical protein
VEQINYWKKYNLTSITLVVHSKYKELTQAYYNLYFANDPDLEVWSDNTDDMVPLPLHVKTVDEALGSAHAIMSSCAHLDGKRNVMISWCDIVPETFIDMDHLQTSSGGGAIVLTNYEYQNRYGLVVKPHKSLRMRGFVPEPVSHGGGVVGLYYLPSFELIPFENGQDFADIITKLSPYGFVTEYKVDKIKDWGDKPKLELTRLQADKARSFNAVEFHGDLVKKSALNDQGDTLIGREIDWYLTLVAFESEVRRPNTWITTSREGYRSFIMTRVQNSVSVWEHWPKLDEVGRAQVLGAVIEQMNLLHDSTSKRMDNAVVLADVAAEAYTKLAARYKEIKHVIDAFGPITKVNGFDLGHVDPLELIGWTACKLAEIYKDTDSYVPIHGDLQFSNSMINVANHEVTLIDPRGYFGKTNIYGLADYDKAKLLYALSGYDLFNYSHDFHLTHVGEGSIEFTLPKPDLTGCDELIRDNFGYVHQLWLAVIWQGLAQYIKNDPVKSVAAHYHGLSMMQQLRLQDSLSGT